MSGLRRGLSAVRRSWRIFLALALLVTLIVSPASAADRYVRASVDKAGRLRIETATGRVIGIAKARNESGFDQIAISPDGAAVGWTGLRVNCCTSYDIPTRLTVLKAGKRHRFEGAHLPVWHWVFAGGGTQVIFHQATVHGSLGIHYEWRDIETGRLVTEWEPAIDMAGHALPNQTPPAWVTEFDQKK
jgi:hypothetical protein